VRSDLDAVHRARVLARDAKHAQHAPLLAVPSPARRSRGLRDVRDARRRPRDHARVRERELARRGQVRVQCRRDHVRRVRLEQDAQAGVRQGAGGGGGERADDGGGVRVRRVGDHACAGRERGARGWEWARAGDSDVEVRKVVEEALRKVRRVGEAVDVYLSAPEPHASTRDACARTFQ
jgi:hypothetical protein